MSAFRASGGMPSGPAALPDLRVLMAFIISVLVGGLMLTSSTCAAGGMSGGVGGGSLLSVSLKCSAHLALWSSSMVMMSPFLSLTGWVGLLFFPERVLVISYNLFMFRCPAAASASSVSSLTYFFLSFLALLLTCRLTSQYCVRRSILCSSS